MLKLKAAAEYLGVSTWTLRRILRSGEIPYVQRGKGNILLDLRDLEVRQFRDVSPTEAWLHLDADTTKNMEARVVPLGSWCVRLIEMLRELVKDKQPDDLIFTRGLNPRPVQRFDKLWKRGSRMAVNESLLVHDLRRTAAQRMLDAEIAVPRIMQNCGWKTMSTFLSLRHDGTQRAAAGT